MSTNLNSVTSLNPVVREPGLKFDGDRGKRESMVSIHLSWHTLEDEHLCVTFLRSTLSNHLLRNSLQLLYSYNASGLGSPILLCFIFPFNHCVFLPYICLFVLILVFQDRFLCNSPGYPETVDQDGLKAMCQLFPFTLKKYLL